jgi:hypothetical protein
MLSGRFVNRQILCTRRKSNTTSRNTVLIIWCIFSIWECSIYGVATKELRSKLLERMSSELVKQTMYKVIIYYYFYIIILNI